MLFLRIAEPTRCCGILKADFGPRVAVVPAKEVVPFVMDVFLEANLFDLDFARERDFDLDFDGISVDFEFFTLVFEPIALDRDFELLILDFSYDEYPLLVALETVDENLPEVLRELRDTPEIPELPEKGRLLLERFK